jgi:hypothetical protein
MGDALLRYTFSTLTSLAAQFDFDRSILFGFEHPTRKHLQKDGALGSKDGAVDRNLLRRDFRSCRFRICKLASARFGMQIQPKSKLANVGAIKNATGKIMILKDQLSRYCFAESCYMQRQENPASK